MSMNVLELQADPLLSWWESNPSVCPQLGFHDYWRIAVVKNGGGYRSRTDDLLRARQAL